MFRELIQILQNKLFSFQRKDTRKMNFNLKFFVEIKSFQLLTNRIRFKFTLILIKYPFLTTREKHRSPCLFEKNQIDYNI